MKLHLEELELARAYNRGRDFEDLSTEQMQMIMERGRELFKWFKAHPKIHNLINMAVIVLILVADVLVLLYLPAVFLRQGGPDPWGKIFLAALVVGLLHGWLMYSLVVFSLHEGAAHHLIFAGRGAFSRLGQFFGNNLCRVNAAEPHYYSACHMAHHAKFGTQEDPEFLNFVAPRRLWRALIPWAVFFNFNDFIIHRPPEINRSNLISALLGTLYNGAYAYLMFRAFGLGFAVLTMAVVVPNVGFYLDRFRQFTEHNLMPLENHSGARSFGTGFWGLLIGGGPWGQPCHLVHHLVPSIPWYQQIALHFHLRRILTERQKEQFLLPSFVGFPQMLWRVIRDANSILWQRGMLRGRSAKVNN
jgi:Fatty acid desaturase